MNLASSALRNARAWRLRDVDPEATGTVRDLNLAPHPVLDEFALGALFAPTEQRTAEQAARGVAPDDALIAEIKAAGVVVAGVPASLKNWINAISRAGVTFR